MTSTFRLLLAAMPDIATACEKIADPHLRDRAFDVLVNAAQEGATTGAPPSRRTAATTPRRPCPARSTRPRHGSTTGGADRPGRVES